MTSLKDIWTRLFGGGEGSPGAAAGASVDYNGYRVSPAPYSAQGQFQTAGIIEKDFPDGTKQHRFVRAETHASKDAAAEFAVAKAKQIIDERGDRLFETK